MIESKLADLGIGIHLSLVVVRLVRMWTCVAAPRKEAYEVDFIAVDSTGFAMHGSIPADMADEFSKKMSEGELYRICMFEITDRGRRSHLAVRLNTVILFNIYTEVQQLNYPIVNFPQHYFSFASFDDIVEMNGHSPYLLDVIGQLEAFTDTNHIHLPNNKGRVFIRDLHLTIASGHKLKISILDPFCNDLDVNSIIQFNCKPIVAITSLRIKEYHGCRTMRSCSATRIYIDPNIPQAIQFRHSIPQDGTIVEFVSDLRIGPAHQLSYHDATITTIEHLLYMNPLCIDVLKFRVSGEVVRLLHEAGWYYYPCQCCSSGLQKNKSGYLCKKHGPTEPQKNLRISLILQQGAFKVQTVVFGELAYRLTGVNVPMLDIAERMNFRRIPSVTDELLNKKFDFVLGVLGGPDCPRLIFKIYQFERVTYSDQ